MAKEKAASEAPPEQTEVDARAELAKLKGRLVAHLRDHHKYDASTYSDLL